MSRPDRILPGVDPVPLQGLFKRKIAAAEIKQRRSDVPVRPRIDRLLQGLFGMIEFEAQIRLGGQHLAKIPDFFLQRHKRLRRPLFPGLCR